jgi:predicted transcriptional regulator
MNQAKEEAIALIHRLPDSVTTSEILEDLLFKVQVERGLRDVAEGRVISHAELKARAEQWRKSTGP